MKTHQEILEGIRAREAGKTAAREGKKMDANPHAETDNLHWDWLDAWCVERSAQNRAEFADKAGIPFLR